MAKEKYSLPFKKIPFARRCTAPAHRTTGNPHCIDFYLPPNTPIRAARDGFVVETEDRYSKSYRSMRFIDRCNYVAIAHDDDEETIYAHLAHHSIKIREGGEVRRGQIIAESGQTGYAWYPHLHFGVYKCGVNTKACFDEELPPKVSYKKYC